MIYYIADMHFGHTNKATFCVDSCNRGCAGARTNVRDQFAGAGIGADQILAELHGLLRGVDAAGHRRHK